MVDRTVSKMLSFNLDKTKAFQPRVIILELGTNDLCVVGQRPESVGSDIEHLVQVLHDHCGAEFIMVCLVIYRSAIPPHVPNFSHKVDLLNKYLKVVLEPLPYAEAWIHRGLQSPSIAVLCRDGVLLNEAGNYAFYRSYRGAILFALKKLATFSEAQ